MNEHRHVRLHAVTASLVACAAIASCREAPGRQAAHAAPLTQHAAPPADAAKNTSVEDEVFANLRSQPIGRHTLADLNLPEALLRREADRVIQVTFEERYRSVMRDASAVTADGLASGPAPVIPPVIAQPGSIVTIAPTVPPETRAYRAAQVDGRPANRGYVPSLSARAGDWPQHEPDASAPQAERDAADLVARRLAFDGLLATTAHVIHVLGAERFSTYDEEDRLLLQRVGLPCDLLRHFTLADESRPGMSGTIERVARLWLDGASETEVLGTLADARFVFQPTRPGFQCVSESGEVAPGTARMHMTRGEYWKAPGDGSNADLMRQLMAAMPQTRFVASVEERFADLFQQTAHNWPLERSAWLTILPEPLGVGPWAQDNSKSGVILSDDAQPRLAMLAPRFASTGDDGSTFRRGETFLLPAAAAAIGAELVHSPLLFQGGNLLCVRDGASGQRVLLAADADIYRNTALGLTVEQALEAFRVECGVDRCEMIDTVSFHLDYDVSVRAVGGGLVALICDPIPAHVLVAGSAVEVLVRAGRLAPAEASAARDALSRGAYREFVGRVAPVVYGVAPDNRFPLSLAERFSTSPVDSGVGNLHRFLLALDYLVAIAVPDEHWPDHPHARSYLRSIQRGESHRAALRARLARLGMQVHAVPSTSDAQRSINAINGVHITQAYLMPAYGGLYSAVDDAAERAIAAALGPDVTITRILSGETQRRSGAVHCSISLFPTIGPTASR